MVRSSSAEPGVRQSKGFKVDESEIIQLLRGNLRDRYKSGFPVIKELLQNCDDGGASRCRLSLVPGLSGLRNPLLSAPALVIANDGRFTAHDAEAIGHLGLSHRAAEKATIGKFGLGLKSVFHLTETIFYQASQVQDGEEVPAWNLINPWDRRRPEWSEFSEQDAMEMRKPLKQFLEDFQTWFFLWLPLRRADDFKKGTRGIAQEFPGDREPLIDFLELPLLADRIPTTLPLLKNLTAIEVWDLTESPNRLRLSVRKQEKAIDVDFDGQSSVWHYFVRQTLLDLPRFRELKASPFWPQQFVAELTDEGEEAPDKSEPHCAAVWMQAPTGSALRIQRATYLPLGEPELEVELTGTSSHWLILHGCYFVDAGRVALLRPEATESLNNENALMARWNRELDECGTLRQILPCLEDYSSSVQPMELLELTARIADSDLFREYRGAICTESNWLIALQPGEMSPYFAWRLHNADQEVLVQLRLNWQDPGALEGLLQIFPSLGRLVSEGILFTPSHCPRLMRIEPSPPPDDVLLRVIEGVRAETVFAGLATLQAFTAILQGFSAGASLSPALVSGLFRILRCALAGLDLDGLAATLQGCLLLVPSSRLVSLKTGETGTRRIFRRLSHLELSVLLVPENLFSGATGRLSAQEALDLLKLLSEQVGESPAVDNLACQIISSSNHTAELLQSAHDLVLFRCRVCSQDNTSRQASLAEFDQARSEGRLFLWNESRAHERNQIFQEFGRALADVEILGIWPDTAEALYGGDTRPRGCNADTCLRQLQKKPHLADPPQRLALLKRLLEHSAQRPKQSDPGALRYLVHGRADQFDDIGTLWLDEGDRLAGSLVQQVLRNRSEDWRLLDDAFSGKFTGKDCEFLRISRPTLETFQDLLELEDCQRLEFGWLSEPDRETLLRHLTDKWFRLLRLHRPLNNSPLASFEARTYLVEEFEIPDEVLNEALVLARPAHPELVDRYRRQAICLDPAGALHLLLHSPRVADLWRVIARALTASGSAWLHHDTLLREVCWLPAQGQVYAPAHVIHLPEVVDKLAPFLRTSELLSSSDLDSEFLDDPAASIVLDKLVPSLDRAIELMGNLLEQSDSRVGVVRCRLEDFVSVFRECDLIPALDVLGALNRVARYKAAAESLFRSILKPVPPSRTRELLDWLSRSYENRRLEPEARTLYLQLLTSAPDEFPRWLPELKLVNQEDRLTEASALAVGVAQLPDSHLLPEEWARQLGLEHSESWPVPSERDREGTTELLEDYFQGWIPRIPAEMVGAFMALFAVDHDPMARVAQDYLGSRSLLITRARLDCPSQVQHDRTRFAPKFRLRLVHSEKLVVRSLAGPEFTATARKKSTSVWAAPAQVRPPQVQLQLRVLDPSQYPTELPSILLTSTLDLLQRVLWFKSDQTGTVEEVNALWATLHDPSQFQIFIARGIILDGIFSFLAQLPVSRRENTRITSYLARFRELKDRIAEARYRDGSLEEDPGELRMSNVGFQEQRKLDLQVEELKRELERDLRRDTELQDAIRCAVREKIERHFQYSKGSIPFELLQNADDALEEWAGMQSGPVLADMVIWSLPGGLAFAHWGRAINEFKSELTDGKGLGYNRDLEKMLLLHNSDKTSDGAVVRTGKFGLGFKSVLLASKQVQLLSGSLCLDILGGIYPGALNPQDTERLQALLAQEERDARGTLVWLSRPDHQEPEDWAKEILQRFRDAVAMTLAFTRRVKRVRIRGTQPDEVAWSEQPLPACEGIFVGRLHGGGPALVVRTTAGSLLCRLGPVGPRPLDSQSEPSAPRVFVTTPLLEGSSALFAMNAPLEVDVGRAALARPSTRNQETIRTLASHASRSLVGLQERSQLHWSSMVLELALDPGASPDGFWSAFWEVFSGVHQTRERMSEADQLLLVLEREVLLALARQAVPSHLPAPYHQLTKLSVVRFFTTGLLGEPDIFILAHQAACLAPLPVGAVIAERAYRLLERLGIAPTSMGVDLAELIEFAAGEQLRFTPELARQWGLLLTSANIEAWKHRKPQGTRRLQELMVRGQFTTRSGAWLPAHEQLCPMRISERVVDEELLCSFAPSEVILSKDYEGSSLELVASCRRVKGMPWNPDDQLIKSWVEKASVPAEPAALRYFLTGRRRLEVAESLQPLDPSLWVARRLREDDWLKRYFTSDEINTLRWLILQEGRQAEVKLAVQPSRPRKHPREIIEDIEDWWSKTGATHIASYEKQLYGGPPVPLSTWHDASKEEWLSLLLAGAFHTIGRTHVSQHGAFLNDCKQEGWLHQFVSGQEGNWVGVMLDFLTRTGSQEDHEYYLWFRQIPSAFQLAVWLDQYVQVILEYNKLDRPTSLHRIVRPSLFSGGGFDAPSAGRVLGIGACFVLRELFRRGALSNPNLYQHCYLPSARVRRLFNHLGLGLERAGGVLNSCQIYDFLTDKVGFSSQRSTFGLTFDLPFQFFALRGNSGWQRRILGSALYGEE